MNDKFRVTRVTVHDQVRGYLQDRIRDGSFRPDAALPAERELAERLGVSRHSLRQAFASLEAMGILETRHGSGVYLRSSPSEDAVLRVADALYRPRRSMADVMEARIGVEPYIATLATRRRDEGGLKALHESVLTFDRIATPTGESNVEAMSFHQRLAQLTNNSVFEGLMRSLLTGPSTIVRLAQEDPSLPQVWHDDHTDIFLAIADRDEQRANRLMTEHLEAILQVVRSATGGDIEPPIAPPESAASAEPE